MADPKNDEVEKEITPEMLQAGVRELLSQDYGDTSEDVVRAVWKAMVEVRHRSSEHMSSRSDKPQDGP